MPSSNPFRYLSVLALAMLLGGCQKQVGEAAAAEVSTGSTSTSAPSGACRLLETSEVRAFFAGARRGEVDDSRKEYGIAACSWSTDRGTFVAQFWESDGSSARDEASSIVLGMLDPLRSDVTRNNVRYEDVPGVGEAAVAVVETADAQRGVLSDFAMLVAQRGNHILVLIAPGLARSERATALEALQTLGKSAVERL